MIILKGAKLLASASKSDTKVGECLKGSEIKILSKKQNINWLRIEIQTSKSETKTLWIENNKEIQEKIKTKGNLKDLASTASVWSKLPLQKSELTISEKGIVLGTQNNVKLKCNVMQKMGSASIDSDKLKFTSSDIDVALMHLINSDNINFSG